MLKRIDAAASAAAISFQVKQQTGWSKQEEVRIETKINALITEAHDAASKAKQSADSTTLLLQSAQISAGKKITVGKKPKAKEDKPRERKTIKETVLKKFPKSFRRKTGKKGTGDEKNPDSDKQEKYKKQVHSAPVQSVGTIGSTSGGSDKDKIEDNKPKFDPPKRVTESAFLQHSHRMLSQEYWGLLDRVSHFEGHLELD